MNLNPTSLPKFSLEVFLRNNLEVLVKLFTLATTSYFLAHGTNVLLAAELTTAFSVEHPAKFARGETELKGEPPPKAQSGRPILDRNFFDSVTGPIDPDAALELPQETIEPKSDDEPLPVVPCDSAKFRLLATVFSARDFNRSFATISQGKEKMLRRIGDEVGEREVAWISWKHVFLEGPEDVCYVDLFGEENLHPKKQKRPARKPKPSQKKKEDNGIEIVSATERIVDRRLVQEVLGDPTKFARGFRFKPYRKKGKVVGYLLRRTNSRSPLSLLGAKRGDVINKINGIALTSMDKALQAYQKLRSANNLTFSITRRGKPMDLKIAIR